MSRGGLGHKFQFCISSPPDFFSRSSRFCKISPFFISTDGRTDANGGRSRKRERKREKRQPVIGGEISNRFGQLFLLFSPFVVIINKSFSTNHSLTKTFYGLSPIYASSSRWKRCKLSSASVGSVSKGERTGCWRKGSNTNNDLFQKEENTVILFFASDLKAKTS